MNEESFPVALTAAAIVIVLAIGFLLWNVFGSQKQAMSPAEIKAARVRKDAREE